MIILISDAVLGGPGPGSRTGRNKAGKKKWFCPERDSGNYGVGMGVAETGGTWRVLVWRTWVCRSLWAQFFCGSGLKNQGALERQ